MSYYPMNGNGTDDIRVKGQVGATIQISVNSDINESGYHRNPEIRASRDQHNYRVGAL